MPSKTDKRGLLSSLFSSLRGRLILLVALAVAPVLGLTFYSAFEQRQRVAAEVQETALRLARLASTEQRQIILWTRQLLIGLAELREVRERRSTECSALFAKVLKAHPLYANLGVIDREGNLYCSARPAVGSINLTDREYFQRTMKASDFAIGDYQIGRVTDSANINFGYPVRDEKQRVQGVIFAALRLDWLSRLMKEAELPTGSTFTVADSNGAVLVRYPDSAGRLGQVAPEPMLATVTRSFDTGVARASEPDGIERLFGFTPLLGKGQAGDVYVSIGIPRRIAYAEADRLLARNLTWLCLIAVVAFTSAWFGGDLFVLRRLKALVTTAKQLGAGQLTVRVGPPYEHGELGELAQTFDDMAASLQENAVQLQYHTTHDSLTRLPNYLFFRDYLRAMILTAGDNSQPAALFILDLDRFKGINRSIGHHNGARLLKLASQRIKDVVGKPGVVARLTGNEFGVLQPGVDRDVAIRIARQLLKAFEEPFILGELPIEIEVSVGIALYSKPSGDADLLMHQAEIAMYQAKEERSGYCVFVAGKDQSRAEHITLLAELRRAIEQNELYLHYQPQVDLGARTVSGVEALLRWEHPKLGTILPDRFIGLAEDTGLIKPLTFWVLKEAIHQCSAWRLTGLEIMVAVNISSRNLEPDLPERIMALLQSCDLAPQYLELEITERTIMKDPVHTQEIFARLKEIGIKISLDDFGTGYSSLSYLSKLPVSQIKIDKSFVINMVTDENAAAIVRSTVELGHQLGLKVIAEGVESRDVLERLKALNCDALQGYYISRPVSAGELADWVRDFSSLPTNERLLDAAG
jgi:diguanylate cyclase (GGDEF)-like protein